GQEGAPAGFGGLRVAGQMHPQFALSVGGDLADDRVRGAPLLRGDHAPEERRASSGVTTRRAKYPASADTLAATSEPAATPRPAPIRVAGTVLRGSSLSTIFRAMFSSLQMACWES